MDRFTANATHFGKTSHELKFLVFLFPTKWCIHEESRLSYIRTTEEVLNVASLLISIDVRQWHIYIAPSLITMRVNV
jgi:hypothetical protein